VARKLLEQVGCLLMGGLSTWWDGAGKSLARASSTITHGKNVGIDSGLQCRSHDQLVDPVSLQSIELT
jgi:hypothetical protein